jgi:hypothetical protein
MNLPSVEFSCSTGNPVDTIGMEGRCVMDYQIQPNTRRCAVTGRELAPGERYFAALIEEGAQFARRDYSAEAWQGPPEGAFSFWSGRVPPADDKAKPHFDDDLLEECFQRLEGQTDPGRVNFRYVVALLLVRRRRFKLEAGDSDAGAAMIVRCVRTGERHTVTNPRLSEEEMLQVQDEVFQVLGWS